MLRRVSTNSLKSFLFAPATAKPTGTPLDSTSNERLVPCLLRSTGLGPVFFPRQGRLGHRPIHRKPTPIHAVKGVVLRQARLPEAQKKAVLHPRLEAVVRRGGGTKPSARERVPLATRAQHKEDGIGANPIRHPRAASAVAVGVLVFGQEGCHLRPKLIANGKAPTRAGNPLGVRARPRPDLSRLLLFGGLHPGKTTTQLIIRIGTNTTVVLEGKVWFIEFL